MNRQAATRRRLRGVGQVARIVTFVGLAAASVAIVRTLMARASPLPAAGALYAATVAYGIREMTRLRERYLFRPGRPPPQRSALSWWAPRLLLVLVVSSLPIVVLLGGLTNR